MKTDLIYYLWLIFLLLSSCSDPKEVAGESEPVRIIDKSTPFEITEVKVQSPAKSACGRPVDDPVHKDPYYNGHLHENFDPLQIDFSEEFHQLRSGFLLDVAKSTDTINLLDCSAIWVASDHAVGIIGRNYHKIQIQIRSVEQDSSDKTSYNVTGKSIVRETECDFTGQIRIISALQFPEPIFPNTHEGVVFAKYEFVEDGEQKHSGTFSGILESSFAIDTLGNIGLDTLFIDADGYSNNTYVGKWTSHQTGFEKKCIWGDYRLPFTFDFDQGDGEMIVNEKYREYGWSEK